MKVLCLLCEFESDGLCSKKRNVRIQLKKKRQCDLYNQDEDKVQTLVDKRLNSKPIPTTYRPEWYHDRRGYINKLKKLDKEKTRREMEMQPDPKRMPIESVKHPLTGDLSRFTSTVDIPKNTGGPNMKNK